MPVGISVSDRSISNELVVPGCISVSLLFVNWWCQGAYQFRIAVFLMKVKAKAVEHGVDPEMFTLHMFAYRESNGVGHGDCHACCFEACFCWKNAEAVSEITAGNCLDALKILREISINFK